MNLKLLLFDEDGQDLTEYGLIILLVSTGMIASAQPFALALVTMYQTFLHIFPALLLPVL